MVVGGGGCLSFCMVLCVGCLGGTVLYVCIEYHIWVNRYHVSTQGIDERMINVHYYVYLYASFCHDTVQCLGEPCHRLKNTCESCHKLKMHDIYI